MGGWFPGPGVIIVDVQDEAELQKKTVRIPSI